MDDENTKNAFKYPPRSWRFYISSEEAWDGMFEACEKAEVSIDFEQFIFLPDQIGTKFADLFARKASMGVKVRLLIDAGGSFAFFNSALARRIRSAGVELVCFNKISPGRIHNFRIWFFRDHRKILIIDGKVCFIGGVGVGDLLSGWRDTHAMLTGEIVSEMSRSFDIMMKIASSEKFIPFPRPRDSGIGNFSLYTSAPRARQRFIYGKILSMIKSAEKSIYVTTPYFLPDIRLFHALTRAAKRKVDVFLLLPSRSDHPYVDWGSRSFFHKTLRSGIKIWQYSSMLHTKSIVVDNVWSTMGSTNMDNYSMFFNYEANIVSTNENFARDLINQFQKDIANARELTIEDWKKRSVVDKILEFILVPFVRFL